MIIRKLTPKTDTNLYLHVAKELGLKFQIINKEYAYCKIYNNEKCLRIKNTSLSINDIVSHTFATDKHLSNQVFSKNNIPCPKQTLIIKDKNIEKLELLLNNKKHYPLVIKPIDKSGGKGVYTNIKTLQDAKKAINFIQKIVNTKSFLIEEYVKGNNYRILTYKDEILDVLLRIPAFITGDGKLSIRDLIDKKNIQRKKLQLYLINKDIKLKDFINKQSKSLDTVLNKNEKICLRGNCNSSEGGETKRINTNSVHKDNIKLFKKITRISGLTLCAIDFISPDISKSHKSVNSIINEINSSPGIDIHYLADNKKDLTPIKKILLKIFYK